MGKPPFHPGDQVQDYIIEQELNVGNMGAVYSIKGQDLLLKAPFVDAGKMLIEQFRKEVETLHKISHPGVGAIVKSDLQAEIPWYTVERLGPRTLRQIIESECPSEALTAAQIILPIAQALGYAHSQEPPLLHRWLRPENIGFKQEQPVLLDFGLANFGNSSGTTLPPQADLLYIAPEQMDIRGKLDCRSEVYTLGVIFYELVSRHPPFGKIEQVYDEERRCAMVEDILNPDLTPAHLAEVPEVMQRVLNIALSKDKQQRYVNAQEMAQALQEVLKILHLQRAKEYEQKDNFTEAVAILQQGERYGLEVRYREELIARQTSRQESGLQRLQQESAAFASALPAILELLAIYAREKQPQQRQKYRKILSTALGVGDSADAWGQIVRKNQATGPRH